MSINFITHAQMRKRLLRVKELNPAARILGMDVGRKYTGLALCDKDFVTAKPYKTLVLEDGDMASMMRALRNTIRSKQIKGLIVGYPLLLPNNSSS